MYSSKTFINQLQKNGKKSAICWRFCNYVLLSYSYLFHKGELMRLKKTVCMAHRRYVCFFAMVILGLFSFTVQAQTDNHPVSWDFETEKISVSEYELIATATIEDGWYVYSQDLEEGGPIPTTFAFIETQGDKQPSMEEIGAVKEAYDAMFEMDVAKYAQKVVFKNHHTIGGTHRFKRQCQIYGLQ